MIVNFVQGAAYLCVWGWAAWHYFTRVPAPHGVADHLLTWAMSLPGLWYLCASARAYVTGRAVSDARVAVHAQELRIGGEAQVRVEQDLLEEGMLEHVRVGLICEKTTGTGKHKSTAVHWQTWASPATPVGPSHAGGERGGRVTFIQALPIPADLPASQSKGDPHYRWKLVVETALAGHPDYREEFDVCVRPAGEAEVGA